MMGRRLAALMMAGLMAGPVAAQDSFMLPDLNEEPENPDCPDAPARPEWVANPSNEGLTRSELATELYQQEGYRNVVEAGECTCELRFPSWDNVTEAMETEFAGISRFEFLEVIPDIRKATKTYRNEGRPICRDAGLW